MSAPEEHVLVRYARGRGEEQVVHDLAAAGMRVSRVLRRVGVVSGTVPAERMAGLGAVEGVQAVERDREVRPA